MSIFQRISINSYHLNIESFKSLENNFSLCKTLTYFALKEEYKRLQLVGNKLAEIDYSTIGNLLVPFLNSDILTKQFQICLRDCFIKIYILKNYTKRFPIVKGILIKP